jgi:aryl-alcohol dehydrogenase-like predicted oxidoreductase
VQQGKVRFIGCSNLSAQQLDEAQAVARQKGLAVFVSAQDEYSLLVRGVERELVPALNAHGMALLPYFPLASGLLTGKYRRTVALPPGSRLAKNAGLASKFINERNWRVAEELAAFAARRGHSMLELAFAWLLREPTVASVIAGATAPEQIEQNVRAAGWTLSPDDLAEIDRIALKQ